jgi:hypothetical protein
MLEEGTIPRRLFSRLVGERCEDLLIYLHDFFIHSPGEGEGIETGACCTTESLGRFSGAWTDPGYVSGGEY